MLKEMEPNNNYKGTQRQSVVLMTLALACLLLAPEEVFGWSITRTKLPGKRQISSNQAAFRIHAQSQRGANIVRFAGEQQNEDTANAPPPSSTASQQTTTTEPQQFTQVPIQTLSPPKAQQQEPQRSSVGWLGADQLNQIKEDVDMISFIETFDLEQFKRTGVDRATALCPFHDDRNPSLGIDGGRGLYKCFSCGAGGDVFNFVRQYHKEHQGGEELPFMQAVRHVHDYCNGASPGGPLTIQDSGATAIGTSIGGGLSSRMSEEERKALAEKQDRLFAMNQEAAAFYANCLTQPWAGGARYYLRSRGFESATTARAFALGFAPDVYFGGQSLPRDQISLVVHLKNKGYNASQILESGLAIQKKSTSEKAAASRDIKQSDTNATSTANNEEVDFESLMDRFRGRLVVPILDRAGKKVVAFGGRILPGPDDDDDDEAKKTQKSGFQAPKYLNSPETAVFQKRQILFGQHIAMEAYQREKGSAKSNKKEESIMSTDPVLMVEGYMDVLALWEAGFRTAVATMGTAISIEQVKAAAKMAAPNGGRVVLCLDSDDAGVAAVERLCSGDFLSDAASSFGVQFLVASLPTGMKDPGDFIEERREIGTAVDHIADEFRAEVLSTAVDWSDWFLTKVLDRYKKNASRGAAGSFGDVFQRVADFLATFPSPAERTKSAYEVSGKLANIMAIDSNSTTISKAARMQLESDLIDSASRIAAAKDLMKRRVEVVNGGSPAETRSLLSAMSKGGTSVDDADEVGKLSRKAIRKLSGPPKPRALSDSPTGMPMDDRTISRKPRPRRRIYRPITQKEEPSLTPHFAGFEFENQSDADWLGVPRNNKRTQKFSTLTIGSPQYYDDNDGPMTRFKTDKMTPVYFNSNSYHGNRFLSNEAINAGYSETKMPVSDYSVIMQQGVGTMVREDVDAALEAAEDILLRNLVRNYPESRNAVRDVLHASNSVGSEASIAWTRPERKWLFKCLLEDNVVGGTDSALCNPGSLRLALACRDDAPQGAFIDLTDRDIVNSAVDDIQNKNHQDIANTSEDDAPFLVRPSADRAIGSLDHYFEADSSHPEGVTNQNNETDSVAKFVETEKASLAAQEHLMSLLSTSASKQMDFVQHDMKEVSLFLHARSSAPSLGSEAALDLEPREDQSSTDRVSSRSIKGESDTRPGSPDFVSPDTDASLPQLAVPAHILRRFEGMSMEEVKLHYEDLLVELQLAIERRNNLDQSSKRITERLMRFSSSTSSETVEGRISVPMQKRIAQSLDDHMEELEAKTLEGTSLDFDEDDRLWNNDEESLEDQLADIESSWGDWCEPDFVWSPSASENRNSVNVLNRLEDEDLENEDDDETLEEALERMDTEWSKWES